jgi:predicted enzyme related to lactoylglutathione lyase
VPKRDAAPIGAPCWIELFTSDADKSRAFYGELFGWTSEAAGDEYGGYINFSKDGVRVAGCMRYDGSTGIPDVWSVYLATDDAQKVAEVAPANGGQVIVPPLQVMDLGTMVVVSDAGGAAIGGWQPGTHKGFGVLAEPGAPSWFELHTRDYDASVAFYREVFKWDAHVMSNAPEFRYTTLGESDDALAGIMDATSFLPEGSPAQWSIYFGVEDTDAALARIADLGGSTVTPPEDTPYGRLAEARDTTGTRFKLVAR